MPINKDLNDLPRAQGGPSAPLRSGTVLAHQLADQWWVQYQAGPDFTRDRAMPELPLRASQMGIRCNRQLWYELTDTPKSNPPGASNVWRMRMGSLIHSEIAATIARNELDKAGVKQGWWAEEDVDLTKTGFPGSAHGDLIFYENGMPTIVCEVKSVGGFAFKLCASSFKGVPEGPRWEHVMQAAIVALAVGAPKIALLYISPEAISPNEAERAGLDEYGKFIAEWQFDTDNWIGAVQHEIVRQKRILELATPNDDGIMWMPTRELDHPDIPVGSIVDNPATGHHVQIDPARGTVAHSGKCWFCGYCSFRDQCLEDGEEMQPVKVNVS